MGRVVLMHWTDKTIRSSTAQLGGGVGVVFLGLFEMIAELRVKLLQVDGVAVCAE